MSSDSSDSETERTDLKSSGRNLVKKAFKTSTAELLIQSQTKQKQRSDYSNNSPAHRRNRSTSDRLHVPLKRNDHVIWLQECNKLHFALESQWPKTRRVAFEIFEDRCIRSSSAVLGMMRSQKEYKYKDVSDFVWYVYFSLFSPFFHTYTHTIIVGTPRRVIPNSLRYNSPIRHRISTSVERRMSVQRFGSVLKSLYVLTKHVIITLYLRTVFP